MNAEEFEKLVKDVRQAQKVYFRTPKEAINKKNVLESMKEVEKKLFPIVDTVRKVIDVESKENNRRKQFFIDVATMIDAQREWMKNQYIDLRDKAIFAERKVDDWLREFEHDRELTKQEEADKMQLKLF